MEKGVDREIAIAQMRLSIALAGHPDFPAVNELARTAPEDAFEIFLDAHTELKNEIERVLGVQYAED